ncbi:MAG: hypothetical protein R6V04_05995 [bacterium]
MHRHIKIILSLIMIILTTSVKAQDIDINNKQFIHLKLQHSQTKDTFTYGLVFKGVNFVIGYSLIKKTEQRIFFCSPDLTLGINSNKGVGLSFQFTPIDLGYGFQLNDSKISPVFLGPSVATHYRWNLYPEIQSGQMYWFTSIELGSTLIVQHPWKKMLWKVTLTNSLAGWCSRNPPCTEKYFFSLKFSDFIHNAHSHFKFGSFNLFNHTVLDILALNLLSKRISLGYEFEYLGYFQSPKLQYLTHSLNLRWKIGKL